MPRWLRRRAARQRHMRHRFDRIVARRRRRNRLKRLSRVVSTLVTRVAKGGDEIWEVHEKLRKHYEEYKRMRLRYPFARAMLRTLASTIVDDDVLRFIEAKQYAAALALAILNENPLAKTFVEKFFAREVEYTIPVVIHIAQQQHEKIKTYMRIERFNYRVFPLLSRESRINLAQVTKYWEFIRDLAQAAIGAVLPLHEYCFETKHLVYHDRTYPTTPYIAYVTVKVTYPLPGTWGLIRDVLLALEPYTNKPDGEYITRAVQAADEVTNDNDPVAVKTNDSRTVRVTLPLWFAELRPSRLEKAAAAALGHREAYDNIKHCSIYRLPAVHYKDDWLKLRYRGRIVRVNVRPLKRRWG